MFQSAACVILVYSVVVTRLLLAVFDKINFAAFFRQKILDRKVDKNDLNFSKQYAKKHIFQKYGCNK